MRAALYFRQSLQVTEGIERQRTRCRSLASARGWTVVDEYVDNDVSASKARGADTAWGRMLGAAAEGHVDVVVAVNLDRLLRTQKDLVTLVDAGLKVATVEGEIDLTSAAGELQASILTSMAQFEVRRKAERQQRASLDRAAKGIPTKGVRPFGWEADRMTVRETEAAHVRWAFAEVLAGTSMYDITRTLNAKGIATTRGGEWSTAQLRKMLERPRNAGHMVHLGVKQAESKIRPLVSEADYQLVLAILNGRKTAGGRKPVNSWLTNVALCGVCGSRMRSNMVTNKGKRNRYYVCETKLDRSKADDRKHVAIKAELLEEEVQLAVYGHMTGGWVAAPKDLVKVREVQAELAEVAAQRAAATDALMVPGVDVSRVKVKLAELEKRAEKLETQRAQMVSTSTGLEALSALDASGDNALAWLAGWKALPIEKRREVARAFKVVVAPGYGRSRVTTSLGGA